MINHGADVKAVDGHVRFLVLDFQLESSKQNQEGENALHSLCACESDTETDLASVARFFVADREVLVNTKASSNGTDTDLY